MPPLGRKLRFPCWLAVVAVLAACAIQDPPPGGPEDRSAPQVIGTFPGADSAGVSPLGEIRVEFSERMQRTRLERQMTFSPPILIRGAGWKGNILVIQPEPLHPDTTYVIELGPGYTDAHGVRNQERFRFAFATSSAIDSGSVAGRVFFRRKPSEKGVVRLFVLPKDSVFAPEAGRPDRQVGCKPDGTYRLNWLPTRQSHVIVWAFHDANENGAFDAQNEFGQVYGDTIVLTAEVPRVRGVDMAIVDPTEPAVLSGSVFNATGNDSFPVTVTLTSLTDTLPPTYIAFCDDKGAFEVRPLTGRYLLQAFMDFARDSLCGTYPCPQDSNSACMEPCSLYPDTIDVDPGATINLDELQLSAPPDGEE